MSVGPTDKAAASGPDHSQAAPGTPLSLPEPFTEPAASNLNSPQQVPWLKQLLSTYAGCPTGNIETRGLDSRFAKQTYVPTSLEAELEELIRTKKVQLVILCGNAGDGKTAFLQHLADKLGIPIPNSTQRVWKGSAAGLSIKLNLDGAAAWKDNSSDQLLDEIFEPFQNGTSPSARTHLVAVNDGRLLQWALEYEDRKGETPLTRWVYATLLDHNPQPAPHIRLVNLNSRSLVGAVGPDDRISTEFLDQLLNRLLKGDRGDATWLPCQTCTAATRCSVKRSIDLLRDESASRGTTAKRVKERLAEALQAVHQRGQVHITTRELRGTLTYIFFGTHFCDELHDDPQLDTGDYFDRAFDTGSERRQGDLLNELPRFDPALTSEPVIDAYLRLGQDANGFCDVPNYRDTKSLSSRRRRAWFEWSSDDMQRVSRRNEPEVLSLYGGDFQQLFRDLATMSDEKRREVCARVCDGIARLEQLPQVVLRRAREQRVVPLKVLPRTPVETTFWVEKPLSQFSLEPARPPSDDHIDWLPNVLLLTWNGPDGRRETLRMSSDLFSLLLELAAGYQLSDASSDDVFANLTIFTQRLAQSDEQQLFAWNPQDDSNIYRIAILPHDGIQQLRLTPINNQQGSSENEEAIHV